METNGAIVCPVKIRGFLVIFVKEIPVYVKIAVLPVKGYNFCLDTMRCGNPVRSRWLLEKCVM